MKMRPWVSVYLSASVTVFKVMAFSIMRDERVMAALPGSGWNRRLRPSTEIQRLKCADCE
jgi:hypothetical protein